FGFGALGRILLQQRDNEVFNLVAGQLIERHITKHRSDMEPERQFMSRVRSSTERAFPERVHRLVEELGECGRLRLLFIWLWALLLQCADVEMTNVYGLSQEFLSLNCMCFAATLSRDALAVFVNVDVPIVTLFPNGDAHVVVFLSFVVVSSSIPHAFAV